VLVDEGMNVARLNFSHGDHAEHFRQMVGVREALKKRPGSHASILLDTKGPEIRTGKMAEDKPVVLQRGQLLELSTPVVIQQLTTRTSARRRGSRVRTRICRVR
jgi:pyruvate kinase